MEQTGWKILWNEHATDTYLFGSKIRFCGREDVEFTNLLMPPGTVIKQWYSKTSYETQRIEPTLPMIDGESAYRLIVNMEYPKDQMCLVRLIFYDRYEEEAGSITLDQRVNEFRCPLKTYSYRMQLINGGVMQLRFHSIIIQEVEHGAEDNNS